LRKVDFHVCHPDAVRLAVPEATSIIHKPFTDSATTGVPLASISSQPVVYPRLLPCEGHMGVEAGWSFSTISDL